MSKFLQYRAIVFDMDGLLLDTEQLFIEAYENACEDLNIDINRSLIMRTYGTNEARTTEIFSNHFGNKVFAKKLFSQIRERYNELTSKDPIKLKPGVLEILTYAQNKSLPMAVATSTSLTSATNKLSDTSILRYFQFVMGGDQVKNGKPHPEIYLSVADRLGVQPNCCLAFEDSDNGVRAAHSAGMTVIQVPDLAAPCEEVVNFNHLIVPSLLSALKIIS